MLLKLFIIFVSVNIAVLARPQFVTYRDGNFDVNFGGYHAQTGLGGLLSGNSAQGGLHASAGTPNGQNAGAGIGGKVNGDGRSAGGAFAGASGSHKSRRLVKLTNLPSEKRARLEKRINRGHVGYTKVVVLT